MIELVLGRRKIVNKPPNTIKVMKYDATNMVTISITRPKKSDTNPIKNRAIPKIILFYCSTYHKLEIAKIGHPDFEFPSILRVCPSRLRLAIFSSYEEEQWIVMIVWVCS